MHFAEGRAAKSGHVTESQLASGVPRANQSQVWSAIAAKAERLQARSETGAMSDMFEAHAASVDRYVGAIPPVARQLGAVFAIDGRPVGIDVFDSPRTFNAMLPKLLRGYAIDALDREISRRTSSDVPGNIDQESTSAAVLEFLSYVGDSQVHRVQSVGAGESWRIVAPLLSGGVLTSYGRIVHASVFRG